MTTSIPYDPPPRQPVGSYSTSPPWAPAAPNPPPPPPQHYQQHGRLMVPYPEEMVNAARPEPPSWVPVVLFTALFGVFGAISAARRATAARRARNDRHPYWIAFGATLTMIVVLLIAALSTTQPAWLVQ